MDHIGPPEELSFMSIWTISGYPKDTPIGWNLGSKPPRELKYIGSYEAIWSICPSRYVSISQFTEICDICPYRPMRTKMFTSSPIQSMSQQKQPEGLYDET